MALITFTVEFPDDLIGSGYDHPDYLVAVVKEAQSWGGPDEYAALVIEQGVNGVNTFLPKEEIGQGTSLRGLLIDSAKVIRANEA